jgi:adenylate kinase
MHDFHDRLAWFKGEAAHCATPPSQRRQLYRLVLLGAPGAGKGTQAELLCARLGTCHLSTGDVFRAARELANEESSPELAKAVDYMRRGELVPDETVLELVQKRSQCLRCPLGFVLDGFPRTVDQADALQKMLQKENLALTAAIHYMLSPDQIIARLSGRRTCPRCKASFHMVMRPSQIEGICDHCGAKLFQREDDQPEWIRVRMQTYQQNAASLLEFYQQRGLLLSIRAECSPTEICEDTITALSGRR